MKAIFVGLLVGAALPEAAGICLLAHNIAYNASHPLGPNEGRCGMPMLGALALIVFVGPVCGSIGAAVALVGSVLFTFSAGQRDQPR